MKLLPLLCSYIRRLLRWKILQACRESRKEARKKYARHEERDTQSGLYAWFVNYEIDTIFLNRGRPFQLPVTIGNSFQETPHGEASEPEWLGVVQKVAFITHGFLERYFQYRHGNLWGWLLKTCPQLKELSYVTFAWFEECTTFEGSLSNVVEVPEIWNGHRYYPQNLRIILRDELTEQQKINGHKTDLKLMWIDLPEAAGRNQQEVFEEEFKQMA